MKRVVLARAAVSVALVAGCSDAELGFDSQLTSVCDKAEEVKVVCEANGGSNGYSCFGALAGTCTGEEAAQWHAAWDCIRARCETGEQQEAAERACAEMGNSIPDACGDGITTFGSGSDGGTFTIDTGGTTGGETTSGQADAGGSGGVGGGGGGAAGEDAGVDAGSAASGGACKSPEQPGCTRCCTQTGGGTQCEYKEWTGGADSMTTPWYNASGVMDGPCPDDCLPCDSCSSRDESDFEMLGDRSECDCTGPIGIDPCFSPFGCDCYCSRREGILDRCPHLAN